MSRSTIIKAQEISGNQYADLASAQRQAIKNTAADFAAIIKRMQADGLLVTIDGQIIPNPERTSKK